MSQLRCPAECAHNSFAPANAGLFGKIESRLLERMQQRLLEQLPELEDEDLADRLEFETRGDVFAAHAIYMEAFHTPRGKQAGTLLERWQQEEWAGLKNDEAVLAKSFMSMRPALMEIQCVLDTRTIEIVDLLDAVPTTFRVIDEDWAAQARRFSVFLGWRYEAPFFSRISGPSVLVPWCKCLTPLNVLQEIVTHLQGPTDLPALREWLWANQVRVAEVINALHEARVMDAGISERKQRRIEHLVPARLLGLLEAPEVPELTIESWRERYANFADQAQPELAMKTPRQAAGDPELRPMLVGLMKQQVTLADETRYQKKFDVDHKNLLVDLGLHELVLPPPPLPAISEEETLAMIDDEDGQPTLITQMLDTISLRGMPRHFRQPPPRQHVLQMDDVEERLKAFSASHATRDSAMTWFEQHWPGVADAIDAMTEETLDDTTYSVVQLQVARAAGVLHPTPPESADGSPQRLAWNLGEDMERLAGMCEEDDGDDMVSNWLTLSVQPALSQRLCAEAHVMMEDLGVSESLELRFAVTALIKAAITEMCYWPVRD